MFIIFVAHASVSELPKEFFYKLTISNIITFIVISIKTSSSHLGLSNLCDSSFKTENLFFLLRNKLSGSSIEALLSFQSTWNTVSHDAGELEAKGLCLFHYFHPVCSQNIQSFFKIKLCFGVTTALLQDGLFG